MYGSTVGCGYKGIIMSKKSQSREKKIFFLLLCQSVSLVLIFCIGSHHSMYFNNFRERKFVFFARHAKKLVKVAPWILVPPSSG